MKDEEFLPQMDELNKRDLGLKRKLTAIEQAMAAFTELDLVSKPLPTAVSRVKRFYREE